MSSTCESRAPMASNLFSASRKGIPVAGARPAATLRANSGWVLIPVPSAVPPMASSSRRPRSASPAPAPFPPAARIPRTPARGSWGPRPAGASGPSSSPPPTPPPSGTGWRAACPIASTSPSSRTRLARLMTVGITSLEDWPAVHVIVGVHRLLRARAGHRGARWPGWQSPRWRSCSTRSPIPSERRRWGNGHPTFPAPFPPAARTIACAMGGSRRPSAPLTDAGSLLDLPERAHQGHGNPQVRNGEVLHGPLGLGAPVGMRGNLHVSHAVRFRAEGAFGHFFPPP